MTEQHVDRSRTYQWNDPTPGIEYGTKVSGLEFLQAMLEGKVPAPPIAHSLDFKLDHVEEGRAVFISTPQEFHYNPLGTAHGGYAATLLDSAMGVAILTTMPQGITYTTVELHVNYVRPMLTHTGKITCEGTVIHAGRKIATAEGRILDENGKLYAHGTTTCIKFPIPTSGG